MVSHRRRPRGEGKVLLERPRRGDDGIALHLEGIQGEGNASVIVRLARTGRVGVVEGVFMEVQVTVTRNARDVG